MKNQTFSLKPLGILVLLFLCFNGKTMAQWGPGTPQPLITVVDPFTPYSYGFEQTHPLFAKSWKQSSDDDFDWTHGSGSTPSSNTGPSAAYRHNHYMFLEASSPNSFNREAILISPRFDLSQLNVPYIQIQTHMFGSNMGSLRLDYTLNNGATWSNLLYTAGNQGNSWENWATYAPQLLGQTDVRFRLRGITGNGFRGDMAVDYFRISSKLIPVPGSPFPKKASVQGQGSPLLSSLTAAGFTPTAYPNPFQNELALRLEAQQSPVNVSIFNLEGKRVYNKTYTAEGNDIAIESAKLPTGTYLLKVTCGNFSETIRIVKQ